MVWLPKRRVGQRGWPSGSMHLPERGYRKWYPKSKFVWDKPGNLGLSFLKKKKNNI